MTTRLLTTEEVAKLLSVSPQQLRHLRMTGSAPKAAKLGKRLYFRESDVEAWIEAKWQTAS